MARRERTVQKGYFDWAEVSEYTGLSISTLRRIIPDYLRFRVSARKVLVKKSELDEWLEQFREQPRQHLKKLADEAVEAVLGK